MLLTARLLADFQSVNSYRQVDMLRMTQGDSVTLYFQLVDASLDTASEGFVPAGRRYVPAVGATLVCQVNNIDDAKKVTRNAQQPFGAQDPSIWALTLMPTDPVQVGTSSLRLTLTEGSKVTNGVKLAALGVASQTNG